MTSIADIRAGFPHKELPQLGTINAHPKNASVRRWQTALNACAATLPSTLAGGIYGHSFLTMKPSLFHTLSELRVPKAPNLPPPDPPPPMISATCDFSSLSNITSVTSSAATSRAAEIIGGGGSGGDMFGALGTRSPERVWKSDGFIVRKECP